MAERPVCAVRFRPSAPGRPVCVPSSEESGALSCGAGGPLPMLLDGRAPPKVRHEPVAAVQRQPLGRWSVPGSRVGVSLVGFGALAIRRRWWMASPGIGFHKWVRENHETLGLKKSSDFQRFVDRDFETYSRHYLVARGAALAPTAGLESVQFNALANFTLQYPLMLAPVARDDDAMTARRKMGLVAAFIEIFIARRVVAYRTLGYSAIVYTMFNYMKGLRGRDVDGLRAYLLAQVDGLDESFDVVADFGMHQQNQGLVSLLLARMTDFVETESHHASSFSQYVDRNLKARYDVEHIWPDIHERYSDTFPSASDFARYRNRFGGLLLLPEPVNRSLGAAEYGKKQAAYAKYNLLAASLDPSAYQNNPGFSQFIGRTGLAFQPYETFGKQELDERQELYRELCRAVWNPARLLA
jgi:hypothetical protein